MKKWKKGLIRFIKKRLQKHIVDVIPDSEARLYVQNLWNRLKSVIDILTDKDPNNKAQFKAWFKSEQGKIINEQLHGVSLLVEKKIKDPEKVQEWLSVIEELVSDLTEDEEEEIPV